MEYLQSQLHLHQSRLLGDQFCQERYELGEHSPFSTRPFGYALTFCKLCERDSVHTHAVKLLVSKSKSMWFVGSVACGYSSLTNVLATEFGRLSVRFSLASVEEIGGTFLLHIT